MCSVFVSIFWPLRLLSNLPKTGRKLGLHFRCFCAMDNSADSRVRPPFYKRTSTRSTWRSRLVRRCVALLGAAALLLRTESRTASPTEPGSRGRFYRHRTHLCTSRFGFFRAPHRSGPRRPCRTTTTVPDDLSPFLFAKQIVKADGATLGPFEETVAQVRAARSPDGGDASFSRVSHQHARVKKPNICAPGGECGRKSRAIRDRAWTRAGRHTGYQASLRFGFCGVFQVSTGGGGRATITIIQQSSMRPRTHLCFSLISLGAFRPGGHQLRAQG